MVAWPKQRVGCRPGHVALKIAEVRSQVRLRHTLEDLPSEVGVGVEARDERNFFRFTFQTACSGKDGTARMLVLIWGQDQ